MKKIVAIFIILLLVSAQFVVFAVELSGANNSGGRVSLFGDISVDNVSKGDVTCVAGNINIHQNVDGNITAVIGNINLSNANTGGLIAVFGNVNVEGNVNGDVVTVFGNTSINGKVTGQVVSVLGKLKLTGNSQIGNGIVSVGGVENPDNARIHGEQDIVGLSFLQDARMALAVVIVFLSVIFLMIGILVIRILKVRFENLSYGMEGNLFKKTIWGFILLVCITFVLPFLSITVIAPVLYVILLILSSMLTSVLIGKLIFRVFNSYPNIYLEFTVGLIILSILKVFLIFAAFQNGISLLVFGGVSIVYSALVSSIGIGILVDSKFGTVSSKN